MGRAPTLAERPRPILFKFCDAVDRGKVWFSKTQLKGTGITMSEFLTKRRHHLFIQARQCLGVRNCWTREDRIYVLAPDGTRQRIERQTDLDHISTSINVVDQEAVQPVVKEPAAVTKTRRPAAGARK